MSVAITTTPTYSPVILAPVDGDAVTGASVVQGLQPVGNSLAYLKQALDTLGSAVTAVFTTLNNSDIIRERKTISGTSGITAVLATILTGTYADVAGGAIAMTAATAGDEIHVDFRGTFFATADSRPLVRVVISSPSQAQVLVELSAEASASMLAGDYSVLSCAGKHTCLYSESYTVKVQVMDAHSPPNGNLTGAWHLSATRIDLTP